MSERRAFTEGFEDIGANVLWGVLLNLLHTTSPAIWNDLGVRVVRNEEVAHGVMAAGFGLIETTVSGIEVPEWADKLRSAFFGQSAQSITRYFLRHQNELDKDHEPMDMATLEDHIKDLFAKPDFIKSFRVHAPEGGNVLTRIKNWITDVVSPEEESFAFARSLAQGFSDESLSVEEALEWAQFLARHPELEEVEHRLDPLLADNKFKRLVMKLSSADNDKERVQFLSIIEPNSMGENLRQRLERLAGIAHPALTWLEKQIEGYERRHGLGTSAPSTSTVTPAAPPPATP